MFFLRGLSTIETLLMTVLMSMVILAALGAKHFALEQYRQQIHRERAQLYAVETFEQLEALHLTRRRQQYPDSWGSFLGDLVDGQYQLVQGDHLSELQMVPADESELREYDEEGQMFTALERKIVLESEADDRKLVMVEVSWGKGAVRLQKIFVDDVRSAFIR